MAKQNQQQKEEENRIDEICEALRDKYNDDPDAFREWFCQEFPDDINYRIEDYLNNPGGMDLDYLERDFKDFKDYFAKNFPDSPESPDSSDSPEDDSLNEAV